MYAQIEKNTRIQNQEVAGQKENHRSLNTGVTDRRERPRITDNRTGVARQLQKKYSASEATQLHGNANQLGQLQNSSSPPVLQRAIDLSTLAETQNRQYYTVAGGGKKLISNAGAPPPEPVALYKQQNNTALNGAVLKIWVPRSKLADRKKISGETPVYSESGDLINNLHEIEDSVLAQIEDQVQAEVNDRQGDSGLRLGTAGRNDCKGFATTLQSMIARYGENPQGLVGRSWLHPTNPDKASFPYHGATVVAQDGADAVTLEAHAGQDLTAPNFHIRRGGKSGFENANKASNPGQYAATASESLIQQIDEANEVVNMLKQAWTDVNVRSDKSAIYESAEQSASNSTGKWVAIVSILLALIGVLVKLSQ